MERVYRIAKWQETFERAESRKLKQLNWIALPIGFGSTGYQELLSEFGDDAPAVYGAWCALCCVAASCHVRGVLCNSRGSPLKLSHIARVTGFPESVFEQLVAWASRTDIGWLEVTSANEMSTRLAEQQEKQREIDVSGESPDDPPKLQGIPRAQDRTEPNKTEQDKTLPSSDV